MRISDVPPAASPTYACIGMGTEMGTEMGMGMSYYDDDDEIEQPAMGHHPQTPQPEALAVPRLGRVSLSQHCHSTLYIVHFIHRGHGVRSTEYGLRSTTHDGHLV